MRPLPWLSAAGCGAASSLRGFGFGGSTLWHVVHG